MELAKLKRQAELEEKEAREQEELARRQVHRPGQKLDLNDFNKAYAEKMELLHAKKMAKKETITREQEGGNTFAPAINKYSRKIAEAGGIKNLSTQKEVMAPGRSGLYPGLVGNANLSNRASYISEISQPVISAAVAIEPVLESA